jgi:hypothetical protein
LWHGYLLDGTGSNVLDARARARVDLFSQERTQNDSISVILGSVASRLLEPFN